MEQEPLALRLGHKAIEIYVSTFQSFCIVTTDTEGLVLPLSVTLLAIAEYTHSHKTVGNTMYYSTEYSTSTGTLRLSSMRFFRAFSSFVRQMPRYNSQQRGTARTLPN